jgi:membrane-associated phospholipid phosphatase
MVIAAMGISVLAYLAYPTAPPRFFEDLGFALSEEVTGNRPILSDPGNPLFNPFAAVPSMHVGLSMILAWSLAYLLRNPFAKVFFFLYPILMTYIVCATGNHWWLDAVFGALTALLALGVASAFAWANPRWALRVEKRLTSDHAETIAV